MKIRIVEAPIAKAELAVWAREQFGDMIKAAVDVSRKVMAVGGELHADEEALLLEEGSRQQDLWGINLYPASKSDDWIEFDSMINIRPSQDNCSRGVEDLALREQIIAVVTALIKE